MVLILNAGQTWLPALLVSAVVGWGVYFLMHKATCGRVLSIAGALIAVPFAAVLVLVMARDCDLSVFLKSELEKGLSPPELSTLKSSGLICPTGYTFVRNGKVHTAIVVDGLIRPEIFIGNDTSP